MKYYIENIAHFRALYVYVCMCVYVNLETILDSNKVGSCVHIIKIWIQYNMVYM